MWSGLSYVAGASSPTTMHAGFTILSIVALMIGVFIIFNSFTISVNQRWKEIAILRSIGSSGAGSSLCLSRRSSLGS